MSGDELIRHVTHVILEELLQQHHIKNNPTPPKSAAVKKLKDDQFNNLVSTDSQETLLVKSSYERPGGFWTPVKNEQISEWYSVTVDPKTGELECRFPYTGGLSLDAERYLETNAKTRSSMVFSTQGVKDREVSVAECVLEMVCKFGVKEFRMLNFGSVEKPVYKLSAKGVVCKKGEYVQQEMYRDSWRDNVGSATGTVRVSVQSLGSGRVRIVGDSLDEQWSSFRNLAAGRRLAVPSLKK